jgi:hypothetical protein
MQSEIHMTTARIPVLVCGLAAGSPSAQSKPLPFLRPWQRSLARNQASCCSYDKCQAHMELKQATCFISIASHMFPRGYQSAVLPSRGRCVVLSIQQNGETRVKHNFLVVSSDLDRYCNSCSFRSLGRVSAYSSGAAASLLKGSCPRPCASLFQDLLQCRMDVSKPQIIVFVQGKTIIAS